ncbi:MAG: translation initiation factor IF-2 [Patescibacteria group bacterium]|nr:translation initiation factor IF-2 [Patescibacteria group bacterium]MDD4303889.1 translation initiation factor IF-2 [Patescibacteria group bacterium]MDD4695124.1 translation initiation factor IF-2 [Patescibacteria group bacterium]
MNITELARQLKTTTSELLEILPKIGFDIGAKAIKVDDSLVDKIKYAYKAYQRKLKLIEEEAKITEIKIENKDDKVEVKRNKNIIVSNNIIVRDLADKMELPINKVMTELIKNGVMVSLNSTIDFETASIIAEDLGFSVEKGEEEQKDREMEEKNIKELEALLSKDKSQTKKPPVVVVMGHVDHGKTKLLDTIRKTNVIDNESGNITQHIGAYKVKLDDREITFLDTPGHEAFRAMRSRGTKIADVAIIVIAADEGLKPQTIESIELVQKEGVPFIIAINKIDKPEADLDRVKKELSEINVIPEDWGGKTICVPISAKEGKNIKELLEMINLVADMENLQADSSRKAIGTIIESHIDRNQGPIASVLVQTGTLNLGDEFVAGNTHGKVRAMVDHLGQKIEHATPSTPVQILGFKNAPEVGDVFNADMSQNELKDIRKQNTYQINKTQMSSEKGKCGEESENKSSLNIILKSDFIGSQEAIMEAINKLGNIETKVKIVKTGLGNINDKDIFDADATKSIILGFHIKIDQNAELIAKEKCVEIKNYKIIYKMLEDLEEKIKSMKSEETIREQIGELLILAIFRVMPNGIIIGGKIQKGKITKDSIAKVIRNNNFITTGKIKSLQSGKQNVNEVVEGQECGLEFSGETTIKEGDILEIYNERIIN